MAEDWTEDLEATVFGGARDPDAPAFAPGHQLGRYAVLEVVGAGSMGTVLRAYDPKLHREVALKQLRTSDRTGMARMIREAQAMAQLSHANVVAVYDVDVGPEGVTLAMELVAGTTLQAWLETKRPWTEVLAVFVQAGEGLLAAHRAGLVHRDFKPANVLVADTGAVKVTDFGLAKPTSLASRTPGEAAEALPEPLEEDATNHDTASVRLDTALTRADVVMGTPRYMAPEQHLGADVGPPADQYAFCLALWEALCGCSPFPVPARKQAAAKLEGPPAWPRGSPVPSAIAEAIRRGMHPQPAARWPDIGALLAALAHDPGRRRRRLLGIAAAMLVAVSIAFVVRGVTTARTERCSGAPDELASTWNEESRTRISSAFEGTALAYAPAVRDRVLARIDGFAGEWTLARTDACEATVLRAEQSAHMMDLRIACLRRARIELGAVVSLLGDADAAIVGRAHEMVEALPDLALCDDVEVLSAEVPPPADATEAERVEKAREELARARSLDRAGRYDDALAAIEALHEHVTTLGYPPIETEVALTHGRVLEHLGRWDESEVVVRPALQSALRLHMWRDAAYAASQLALLVGSRGTRKEEGLWLADLALGLSQGQDEAGALEAEVHNARGLVLDAGGDFAAAAEAFRIARTQWASVRGEDSLDVATARNNLGLALNDLGEPATAEEEFRAALATRLAAVGDQHPLVATTRNNLAIALQARGRVVEAETELRIALALREAAFGPGHPRVIETRNNIANILQMLGRDEEAQAELRSAIAAWERKLGPNHATVASARNNLALVLVKDGRHDEADVEFRKALAILEAELGVDHPDVATVRANMADVQHVLHRDAEAEAMHQQALAAREKAFGADHPSVASSLSSLAGIMLDLHREDEAEALLERAHAILERVEGRPDARAAVAFALAKLVQPRDRDRARALAEGARDRYEEIGEPAAADRAEVEAWLAARAQR